MCGIAGILRVHPVGTPVPAPEAAIPEAWLDILDESIKHRGPDGRGRFRGRAVRADGTVVDVALVHRRLSIIDHAGGAQPMVSPRGRRADEGMVAVVFNGCIYNHRDLRKELQAAGHRFETDHSDTEVLVHGWRQWREHLPDHLNGMFAAAIWDEAQARLLLIRDCFGEKPLYLFHAHREGAWLNVFSSVPVESTRLPRVIGASDVPIEPASSVAIWLRFGFDACGPGRGGRCVSPGTAVDYVQRGSGDLHPGEEFRNGAPPPAVRGFGPVRDDIEPIVLARERTLEVADVERLLASAVAARLEADVEVGCFLSGGVDSSLVAHFARQARPDLRTFTVRMPDARFDESAFAHAAAGALGTRHTTLDCASSPAQDLVHLIHQIGLPFGDSSLLPSYWLCRAAREHVAVALGGDGGDEFFLGYDRYVATRLLKPFVGVFRCLSSVLSSTPDPGSRRARAARLLDAAQGQGYFDLLSIFPSSMLRPLVTPGDFDRAMSSLERVRIRTPGVAAAYDAHFYLPYDLMRKSDSASMSVALEVRSPFLDPSLAESALSCRVESLMPGGQRKGLLRAVARKYLPAEIVDRPKQGFAVPIGEWFRSDYGGMKQLLMDHLNSAEPWGPPSLGIDLNMKFVRQMLDEHMGTGPSGRIVRDHSQRLYMLLVLSIWAKRVGRSQ